MSDLSLHPAGIETFHLAAPLAQPRRNAFGEMTHRPALFVRLTDRDGGEGWGEAFCNWPIFGAAHRKRILEEILGPALTGREFAGPAALWQYLTTRFAPIALQANEPGPFEQTIAALDIAAWDLVARRADMPLHALLSPDAEQAAPRAYASALTAERQGALVPPLVDAGWEGFKLKVGFALEDDLASARTLRRLTGDRTMMLDANQRWTAQTAQVHAEYLAEFDPLWLEEPLPADAPASEWRNLAQASPVPLAAGENIRGEAGFLAALDAVSWLQPDPIKWGGISRMRGLARMADKAGAQVAMHYLGGGIGLLATAHLARALGTKWFEMDVTENPLRDVFSSGVLRVEGGRVTLSDIPGHGGRPTKELLERYAISNSAEI